MFSYYGSKSKIIHLYPEPQHDLIIEPFAGSARYSLRYWQRDVILCDKYHVITDVWKWLQKCSPKDLDALPLLRAGDKLEDYDLSDEERNYLGFVISEGVSSPRKTVTQRAAKKVNYKIQNTKNILHKIRHWKIVSDSYQSLKSLQTEATWFIDPPYQNGGQHYPCSSKQIDYNDLAEFCLTRNGQVIVCENNNANWLPFSNLKSVWGGRKSSTEVLYCNNQPIQHGLFFQ